MGHPIGIWRFFLTAPVRPSHCPMMRKKHNIKCKWRCCAYLTNSKGIRITSCCFGALEPFPHSWQTKETIQSNNHRTWHFDVTLARLPPEIQKIGWQHRQKVQTPTFCAKIVCTQFGRIAHQQSLIQVTYCEHGRSRAVVGIVIIIIRHLVRTQITK